MATSRGRRARLRLRTLVRWLCYFETTPVSHSEILLRRIPNSQNFCFYDSHRKLIVDPYAFTPRKTDIDGMSFYREDFATNEELVSNTTLKGGARVARITVEQLIGLGIAGIVPDPISSLPGHVYIPALKYIDPKTLIPKQKQARQAIFLALAQHATTNGVWASPGLADPIKLP